MIEFVLVDLNGSWGIEFVEFDCFVLSNNVGMVGWLMYMCIFEFFDGWKVLVVFNDVMFSVGFFGFKEDVFFKFMSDWVCCEKFFFIYFVVNLGVCIGVVEEVCVCFCIGWLNEFFFD